MSISKLILTTCWAKRRSKMPDTPHQAGQRKHKSHLLVRKQVSTMTSLPGGDSPPRTSPRETLIKFASLMGTFRLKKAQEEAPSSALHSVFVPNNEGLNRLMQNHPEPSGSVASFPCLSLDSDGPHESSDPDKTAVQAHAATNLARLLQVGTGENDTCNASYVDSTCSKSPPSAIENPILASVGQVPDQLLANLQASFALLIEARLRAYITILARHGVSLATCPGVPEEERDDAILAVEQKLQCLLEIGTNVSMDNLVTNFGCPKKQQQVSYGQEESITLPLGMGAGFDISIPSFTSDKPERFTVAVKTSGTITGTFHKDSHLLATVRVELDTHKLLNAMVHEAARVISIALDHANEVTSLLHPLQAPSDSASDEPPPKKRKVQLPEEASNLASGGQALPVVSPDLNALLASPAMLPPPLELQKEVPPPQDAESETRGEPEVCTMSPGACAKVVDYVMGELDCAFCQKRETERRVATAPRCVL